jgi:hypothetical protein
MGIMLFKFNEYVLSVYHNGIVRSNSTREKDACRCFSCVVLRSRVYVEESRWFKASSEESHKFLKQCNVSNVQSESDGDKNALKQKGSQVAKLA